MDFLTNYLLETTGSCCIGCSIKKIIKYNKFILLDLIIMYIIFRSVKTYKMSLLISVLYIKLKFLN